MTIEALRKKLDAIDEQIITLLSQRMTIVEEIGKIKKEMGTPPLDKKRWKEVLSSRLSQAQKLKLSLELVEKIYENIHAHALELESKEE